MASWTEQDLTTIGNAEELRIASRRRDGTLRPYVVIWVVRVGNDVYVRTAYGPDNPWFVRAKRSRVGRIKAGRFERDVSFEDPEADSAADSRAAIDAAYHAKYDRHGPRIVGTVVSSTAAEGTLRLVPTD